MVIICDICKKIVNRVDRQNLCDQCGAFDFSTVLPNYYHLWQVNEHCRKCEFPLHVGKGQDQAFCPICIVGSGSEWNSKELVAKLKATAAWLRDKRANEKRTDKR